MTTPLKRLSEIRQVAHDAWVEAGGCETCQGYGIHSTGERCGRPSCTPETRSLTGHDPMVSEDRAYRRLRHDDQPRHDVSPELESRLEDLRRMAVSVGASPADVSAWIGEGRHRALVTHGHPYGAIEHVQRRLTEHLEQHATPPLTRMTGEASRALAEQLGITVRSDPRLSPGTMVMRNPTTGEEVALVNVGTGDHPDPTDPDR